jgi:hypothetical protein
MAEKQSVKSYLKGEISLKEIHEKGIKLSMPLQRLH